MPPKRPRNTKEKIIDAALALAAEQGWEHVSMTGIAQKAKIKPADLQEHFEDRFDILTAWGRMIDERVQKNAGKPDPSLSPRDRLFDALMDRLEILNERREAVCSILGSVKCDPRQAVIGLPHLCRSMSAMLDAAGIESGGPKGALKVAGLTALYLKTLWVWRGDDSPDLSKTMAALDKNLGRAESLAETFGLS